MQGSPNRCPGMVCYRERRNRVLTSPRYARPKPQSVDGSMSQLWRMRPRQQLRKAIARLAVGGPKFADASWQGDDQRSSAIVELSKRAVDSRCRTLQVLPSLGNLQKAWGPTGTSIVGQFLAGD